jgi:hypothetical protein
MPNIFTQAVRLLLFYLGVFLCGGCTTHINDVEFVGLEPATPSMAQKKVEYTWIPANGVGHAEYRSASPRISQKTLRLRFRSRVNLTAIPTGAGDYVEVSLCPYRYDPFVSMSVIYAEGIDIDTLRQSHGWVAKEWDKGRYIGELFYDGPTGIQPYNGFYYYDGFIEYEKQSHFDEAFHGLVDLPLPKGVQSLCFKLDGPTAYESNEVKIAAEVVSSALAAER